MTKQLRLDSSIRIIDGNREILALGFAQPELFKVMNGERIDPEMEKRYLQLWLNQMQVVWLATRSGLFQKSESQGMERDIADSFKLPSMQTHWVNAKHYYSGGFRRYVEGTIGQCRVEPQELPTPHDQVLAPSGHEDLLKRMVPVEPPKGSQKKSSSSVSRSRRQDGHPGEGSIPENGAPRNSPSLSANEDGNAGAKVIQEPATHSNRVLEHPE